MEKLNGKINEVYEIEMSVGVCSFAVVVVAAARIQCVLSLEYCNEHDLPHKF